MPSNVRMMHQASTVGGDNVHLDLTAIPDSALNHVAQYLPKPYECCLLFQLRRLRCLGWAEIDPAGERATGTIKGWYCRAILSASASPLSAAQMKVYGRFLILQILTRVLLQYWRTNIFPWSWTIDAANNLKRLKLLAGCIGITRCGIGPIMHSRVLEQINLSLVGDHESLLISNQSRQYRKNKSSPSSLPTHAQP